MCGYLQSPTVEGDNQMLPQQVVKILLKLVQVIRSGDEKGINDWRACDAQYLINPIQAMLCNNERARCKARDATDFMDTNVLLEAYQHRAARLLVDVAQDIQEAIMGGSSTMQQAWNGALIQMARISRAHSLYLLLEAFVKGIAAENKKALGAPEVEVMKDLATLFGLSFMERDIGDFLEDGYIDAKQARWIRRGVLQLLGKVRPNAVALVDARDFSDFRLKSALGRNDGHVYPAIMAAAKKDPLNSTDPGPGYEHLKRLIVDGAGVFTGTASRL